MIKEKRAFKEKDPSPRWKGVIGASRYNSRDVAYSPFNRMGDAKKIITKKQIPGEPEANAARPKGRNVLIQNPLFTQD